MVHLTKNFLAESPLSPLTRGALLDAIDQGWQDPRKLSQSSARARILFNSAIESLASHLQVQPFEIEIIGETGLAPYLCLAGLLRVEQTLVFSSVDRKEVFALARSHGKSLQLEVDRKGQILADAIPADSDLLLSLQGANAETGVLQDLEKLISQAPQARVALDFSAIGTRSALPSRWDSAIFDAKSWQGPQGIALLLIRDGSPWRNPLPHLNSIRTPQTSSLPLLIATAVALEESMQNQQEEDARLREMTEKFRAQIGSSIEDCDIAGDLETSLPHITSLSFLYVQGEELLRTLERAGFSVDSGSACTADDLQPSHVLAAMGLLTHGNIRITLHRGSTQNDVNSLVTAVKDGVAQLRAQ